jgi:hypothetical protein
MPVPRGEVREGKSVKRCTRTGTRSKHSHEGVLEWDINVMPNHQLLQHTQGLLSHLGLQSSDIVGEGMVYPLKVGLDVGFGGRTRWRRHVDTAPSLEGVR